MTRDYYELLGVSKDADDSVIKKAYRKLAMKWHPDKNNGTAEAEEKFKSISEAYATLCDAEKRSIYDKYGVDGVRQMEGGGAPVDPSDIFQQMFGGGVFSGRPTSRRQKVSRTKAFVDLKTFVRGGTIDVQFTDTVAKNLVTGDTCMDYVLCGTCKGNGVVTQTHMIGPGMYQQATGKCGACGGRGYTLNQTVEADCIWMDEVKEFHELLPAGHDLTEPLVLFERGGICVDPHTKEVKRCDLHVHVQCEVDENDEWQLYSPQHRHLQWTPKLQVVYGMVTNRLKCVHPNGQEYILEMPEKNRTEPFVAPQLGLPAADGRGVPEGDLIVKVLWDFDTAAMANMPWLVQMKKALHQRAPWTDDGASVAHTRCLTTEEYEAHQRQGDSSRQHRHPNGMSHGMGEERGGNCDAHPPECVQS